MIVGCHKNSVRFPVKSYEYCHFFPFPFPRVKRFIFSELSVWSYSRMRNGFIIQRVQIIPVRIKTSSCNSPHKNWGTNSSGTLYVMQLQEQLIMESFARRFVWQQQQWKGLQPCRNTYGVHNQSWHAAITFDH